MKKFILFFILSVFQKKKNQIMLLPCGYGKFDCVETYVKFVILQEI